MPCYSPRYIVNKSVFWREGIDPIKIKVGCGHCKSCLKEITDSFYVRAKFEYLSTYGLDFNYNQIGPSGFVLFPTLTYKPKNRPRFKYIINEETYEIEGFSHKHIRKYVKQINDRFHDVYPYSKQTVKYIICSEYGYDNAYLDDKGNVRKGQNAPHYHALFFFPSDARKEVKLYNNNHSFTVSGIDYWTHYVKTLWQKYYGKVEYSKKFGAEVKPSADSNNAIKYVIEYACKQHDFMRIPNIRRYLLQDIPSSFKFISETDFNMLSTDEQEEYLQIRSRYKDFISQREKEIKSILPNHWQSSYFGITGVDYLRNLSSDKRISILTDGIMFKDDLSSSGKMNVYKFPKYLEDKVYVDIISHEITNDKGNLVNVVDAKKYNKLALLDYSLKFDISLNKKAFDLQLKCLEISLTDLSDTLFNSLNTNFKNKKSFTNFAKELFKRYSPRFIASYCYIKNIGFNIYNDEYKYLLNCNESSFINYTREVWLFNKLTSIKTLPAYKGQPAFLIDSHHSNCNKFNDLCINDIDILLDTIYKIDVYRSKQRKLVYDKQKEEKLMYRRLTNYNY